MDKHVYWHSILQSNTSLYMHNDDILTFYYTALAVYSLYTVSLKFLKLFVTLINTRYGVELLNYPFPQTTDNVCNL